MDEAAKDEALDTLADINSHLRAALDGYNNLRTLVEPDPLTVADSYVPLKLDISEGIFQVAVIFKAIAGIEPFPRRRD